MLDKDDPHISLDEDDHCMFYRADDAPRDGDGTPNNLTVILLFTVQQNYYYCCVFEVKTLGIEVLAGEALTTIYEIDKCRER